MPCNESKNEIRYLPILPLSIYKRGYTCAQGASSSSLTLGTQGDGLPDGSLASLEDGPSWGSSSGTAGGVATAADDLNDGQQAGFRSFTNTSNNRRRKR